ncbi:MAG: carbohydrate ABC transporter permease [Eubacteriales bacterium]|nr:carbohydrate ABC transporter permease [Eubacteriales bacterium]
MKIQESRNDKIFDAIVLAVMTVVVLIVTYPLYFVVIASFSNPTAVNLGQVTFVPKGITFEGYRRVFTDPQIWVGYRNSVFYTVVGTCINLALTLTAGYALSRRELPGRKGFMLYLVITMFFSGGIIPSYFLIKNLNMLNTIWALLIPGAVSVYNLIIARTFLENNIPEELYEATCIDGGSHTRYFLSVVLPLSKSVIAVLALYYAVFHWNSYFNAMMYIKDSALFPLQIVLRNILISSDLALEMIQENQKAMAQLDNIELMKYSAIIVSSLPVLIIYPFVQKHFVKGVMIGAVKG